MSTMTDETYNGYANRETWAFNLHWQNDQGLYSETLAQADQYLTDTYGRAWPELPEDELRGALHGVGEHVVRYWDAVVHEWEDDFGERPNTGIQMFRDEVGSWWRVDYAEVGAAVRESLDAES